MHAATTAPASTKPTSATGGVVAPLVLDAVALRHRHFRRGLERARLSDGRFERRCGWRTTAEKRRDAAAALAVTAALVIEVATTIGSARGPRRIALSVDCRAELLGVRRRGAAHAQAHRRSRSSARPGPTGRSRRGLGNRSRKGRRSWCRDGESRTGAAVGSPGITVGTGGGRRRRLGGRDRRRDGRGFRRRHGRGLRWRCRGDRRRHGHRRLRRRCRWGSPPARARAALSPASKSSADVVSSV